MTLAYNDQRRREKKTMMKKLTLAVLAAVPLALTGCAGANHKKAVACHSQPQWFTSNEKGEPVAAVFVCFAEDNTLKWQARPITADEVKALTPPAPVVKKAKGAK